MNLKLLSASAAAMLALGFGSVSAKAAQIGGSLNEMRPSNGLVQKAHYDDDDWRRTERYWWWRHHRRDDDDDRRVSWWRHRWDRDDDRRHAWRDRDDRNDRDDDRRGHRD